MLQCDSVLCAARANSTIPCWRLPYTRCDEHGASVGAHDWERCLACLVFEAHAASDPRGERRFVLEEVRQFMQTIEQ
ncbi:MAG: hypothetical protein JSW39_15980, partial [Desulfobacterales bacterium]